MTDNPVALIIDKFAYFGKPGTLYFGSSYAIDGLFNQSSPISHPATNKSGQV